MPKSTSWAEVMSNSKKIKPVALGIIELCLTEGISQAGSQAVSQKKILFNKFFKKILWQLFESISGRSEVWA